MEGESPFVEEKVRFIKRKTSNRKTSAMKRDKQKYFWFISETKSGVILKSLFCLWTCNCT